MTEVEEMMVKLKTEELALHDDLVGDNAAHARALMDNVCVQCDKKNVVKKSGEAMRLLAAEKNKWKNNAVVEQLKMDVLTVRMKAAEEIGTLTASLEQAKKKVCDLEKERDSAIRELGSLGEGKERAE